MMTALTLYAGAGGADLGLRAAGFEHVACVEADEEACATLAAAGFPAVRAWIGPSHENVPLFDPRPFIGVGMVWASPPCPPYSRAGKGLGADDPRDGWPDTLAVLRVVQPRWAVIENVVGAPVEQWIRDLTALGFHHVSGRTLDAADYGVPQTRNREFIVAGPHRLEWPAPTHYGPKRPVLMRAPGMYPWVSMGDAIPGLRFVGGDSNPRFAGDQRTERELTHGPSTTISTKSGNALPVVLVGGRAGSEPWRLDMPSPTVMTTEEKGTRASAASGFTFNGGPDRASDAAFLATGRRRISISEAATLQSFPDGYPFQGTKEAQYRQVGNAVPPRVSMAIGLSILEADKRRAERSMCSCGGQCPSCQAAKRDASRGPRGDAPASRAPGGDGLTVEIFPASRARSWVGDPSWWTFVVTDRGYLVATGTRPTKELAEAGAAKARRASRSAARDVPPRGEGRQPSRSYCKVGEVSTDCGEHPWFAFSRWDASDHTDLDAARVLSAIVGWDVAAKYREPLTDAVFWDGEIEAIILDRYGAPGETSARVDDTEDARRRREHETRQEEGRLKDGEARSNWTAEGPRAPSGTRSACGCSVKKDFLRHVPSALRSAMALSPGDVPEEMSMTVDAAMAWRMMADKNYPSGDLAVIATREALQNAIYAIRKAYKQKVLAPGEGRFDVTWDRENRRLTWTDNGIGMDRDTLRHKFLALGGSGQRGDAGAPGGFGIAKAVILGISRVGKWHLHTRDNVAVPVLGTSRVNVTEAAPRVWLGASSQETGQLAVAGGTQLIVEDVDPRLTTGRTRSEGGQGDGGIIGRSPLSFETRLHAVLAGSDLHDLTVSLNGDPVQPWFKHIGGTPIKKWEDADWGDGNAARVRAFSRRGQGGVGAVYVRLAGLLQFVKVPWQAMKNDIVVDIRTTKPADDRTYPFTMAREALAGQAHTTFEQLFGELEQEAESAIDDREYTEFSFGSTDDSERDAHVKLAAAVASAFDGEEFRQQLAEVERLAEGAREGTEAVNLAGILGEMRGGRTVRGKGQADPSGAPGQRDTPAVHRILDSAAKRNWRARDIVTAIEAGETISIEEAGVLTQAVEGQLDEEADTEGVVATVAAAEAAGAAIRAAVEPAQRAAVRAVNPYVRAFSIEVSKSNYNPNTAHAFRRNIGKHVAKLAVWDGTLRLLATAARKVGAEALIVPPLVRAADRENTGHHEMVLRVPTTFRPGFVLDKNLLGMQHTPSYDAPDRTPIVMINPDHLDEMAKAHRKRPLALAAYVHAVACHEIAHLMRSGHDETFSVWRENLHKQTTHLLPAIEQLCIAFGLAERPKGMAVPRGPAGRTVARGGTPRPAHQVGTAEEPTLLDTIGEELLANPPPGLDPAYLRGFLQRQRRQLTKIIDNAIGGGNG